MNADEAVDYAIETSGRWIGGHPEEARIRELLGLAAGAAARSRRIEQAREVSAELHTATLEVAPAIIPATPGYRLVVLGPDQDLDACPIVAWQVDGSDPVELLPIAILHGQDGIGVATWANRYDRIVGILTPGEEMGQAWVEEGERLGVAIAEAEAREEARS